MPGPPAAPPAAKPAAQAGEAAAETKPDTRPGEICETCKAADEDKDDKPGMVRAGGDANVDVIYSEGTGSTQSVGGSAPPKARSGLAWREWIIPVISVPRPSADRTSWRS